MSSHGHVSSPRSDISGNEDKDKDTNNANVSLHEFYESTKPKFLGCHMVNAMIIANDTVELLLERVHTKITEKSLQAKLVPHIIQSTRNLMELIITTEKITVDRTIFTMEQDEEAV
jgi:hypothetical protein